MIPVSCPQCGLGLRAPDDAVGRKAKCRRCQTTFVIALGAAGPTVAGPTVAGPSLEGITGAGEPGLGAAPSGDWMSELTGTGSAATGAGGGEASLDEMFGNSPSSSARPAATSSKSSGNTGGVIAVAVGLCAVAAAIWFLKPASKSDTGLKLIEMPPQTIAETRPYHVQMSAGTGNPDTVLEILDGPEGAAIDLESGALTWTPSEAQGPGEYTIAIVTKQKSTGTVTSRVNLQLKVDERPEPPVFDPVEIPEIDVGEPVTVRVSAKDTDIPSSPVTYSLKGFKTSRSPELDAATGTVTWTPADKDAGKKLLVVVVATEQGGKQLSTEHPLYFQVRKTESSLDRIVAQLEAGAGKVERTGNFTQFDLKGDAHVLNVEGDDLYLFLYRTPAAAMEEAESLQGDAARLSAAATRAGSAIRYYRSGDALAAYLGKSEKLLSSLDSIFGKPFAEAAYVPEPTTQTKRDPGDEVLLTLYRERDRRTKSARLFSPFEYAAIRKVYADRFEKSQEEAFRKAFGDQHDEMRKWLDDRKDFKESLFLAFDTQHDHILNGLKIVRELKEKFPKQVDRYQSLVVAMAVVWDKPNEIESYAHHQERTHSILPSGMLGAIENFQYLIEAEPVMQGRIQYSPWEFLVHVVNQTTPLAERQWALANYGPRRAMFGKCYSDVPYDMTMLQSDDKTCKLAGKEYTLPNILGFGGVCAMQADFAARVGKSIGAPAEYVTGASASGDLHAWVMWVELTAATPTSVAFTLQSHGRYRGDNYYVGQLRDPHTGRHITDRDLERRLNSVGTSAFNKRQADLAMDSFAMIRDELKLDLGDQLEYLAQVTRLCPWNEEAWMEAARLSQGPALDKRTRGQMAAIMNQLFVTFAPMPDFTLRVFPTLVDYEPDAKTRIQHYYKLLDLYAAAKRPDLSFNALLILANLLVENERQGEAIQGLAAAIKKYADEGQYVPRMLDRLESLCETPEHKAALIAFYGEFLPLIPTKRGEESSKYCMQMYERGIKKFQEAGQPQLAAAYQQKLAQLKSN